MATEGARRSWTRASVRVRAALAGGLVLGLGAGLTAASWTDAVAASGTIAAGRLELQTKPGSAGYSAATTVTAEVSGVYPGPSGAAYLPILVRTSPASVAGTVSFSHQASASAGLSSALRYRVVRSTTCAAAAFTGTPVWVVGDATTAPPVTTASPAIAGPLLLARAGSVEGYCVEFTLGTGLAQATYQGASSGDVSFTFTGSAG